MILERDQWHLGYASLLRECRGSSSSSTALSNNNDNLFNDGAPQNNLEGIPSQTVGRALLLVHPDTDAMATARILSYMLRADGVPYQMRPCLGWERLKNVLCKVGVLPPNNNEDADNEEDENDEEGIMNYIENETDIRAVVLMNMGANRNLSKLFRHTQQGTTQDSLGMSGPLNNNNNIGGRNIKCYVFDCHRPYHLANVHAGKNVVLFNDRPFDDEELVSDGDNLSGDESSSSDESDDDDDSDDEGEGGNGRKRDSDSEGEQEFELEDEKSLGDKSEGGDSDDDDGQGRESKRQRRDDGSVDPADDPAQDPEQRSSSPSGAAGGGGRRDDLQDSEDEGDDDYASKKDGGRNVLDTTAVTADMTMLDETFDTSVLDQSQVDGQQQDQNQSNVVSFRELHRQRRNRIRLHYSAGSYHASPSAWTVYTLCRQLRFGDTPDLLWLACVGVTDAYLHGRLDVAGYGALTLDLKRHVGRLFPNELVDRVGRAVYAEELEADSSTSSELGGRAWTQIGLSENGRILSQQEYKFMLLRHTSLWDSLLHSNFVASKLQVWKNSGRQRLMEMLAKMGFPLDQCRQPWAFVGPGMRRRLNEKMADVSEDYELGNVSYTGFVRVTGYQSLLSASDMSYAVTALLECSAAAIDGIASKEDANNDLLTEEDREDREMVEAFNVAFDALNSNGSSTSATGTLTSMEGGVEGGDLSNLVNGGNMTGTTGLGAGIRLAMTLQRNIMSTARSLVDRNAIVRLSHFRYAYLHCSSNGGSNSAPGAKLVTPDVSKTTEQARRNNQFHVFAKPLVLTKLAHFLMDMHRENGKWTGSKSRPLILLAEKPRSNSYMVIGYEYPEESGDVVKNKFGQNFEMAAKSMKGLFWFDSFDSNVIEVAARDVQKFLEQLHYMMEQV